MAFNKMFVMLPVMLAARKLDSEDPNVVYWLRVAYACVQVVVIAVVGFTYIQAQGAASKASNKTIYVPPPPQVRSEAVSRNTQYPIISWQLQSNILPLHRHCLVGPCLTPIIFVLFPPF